MTTKREAQWSEQTKAQNTEKGMYVGLKQPRGDGERYVTPARAAAKETKGKRELSQKPNLCWWGAWEFPQKNRRTEKYREFLPQKFNGPRLGRYPGQGCSFALAIWVCTSVAPKSFCSPNSKSMVFQSNLYCKKIIRFSPSFRKNIQHFHLISSLDLILHTETNDDH